MDIQRIVLGGALAVTTYLLILQWNQDYGQPEVVQSAAEQPAPVSRDSVSLDAPATPASSASDALPSETATTAAAVSIDDTTNTNEWVVESDTLRLTIDLNGGDVVRSELIQYPIVQARPELAFALLDNRERTYLAQSGLTQIDTAQGRPQYRPASDLQVMQSDRLEVPLVWENGQVRVTKTFTLVQGSHTVQVTHQVENLSAEPLRTAPFFQLKRDNSSDPSTQTSMGVQAFLGYALKTAEERYFKIDLDEVSDRPYITGVNTDLKTQSVAGSYLALVQHYFVSAWVPDANDQPIYSFTQTAAGDNVGRIVGQAVQLAPGQSTIFTANLYTGPKDQDTLESLSDGLNLTVDYGWLWFISQPIFIVLSFLQEYLGNWGLSIMAVTLLVKLAFFKLSASAYASMARMRKFTPEMTRLRELYGDDKQRLSKEMMDLYKKEKINPLGGCLPILVQMPVFLALYWVLLESVELRHAPFFLWITDLSVKDPYFVLPLLMGVSMFIQQMLNPTPPDPMQAKIMRIMPVAFTFFFLWFPAGLVLYWVTNNVLSIAQQYVITKRIEQGDTDAA